MQTELATELMKPTLTNGSLGEQVRGRTRALAAYTLCKIQGGYRKTETEVSCTRLNALRE